MKQSRLSYDELTVVNGGDALLSAYVGFQRARKERKAIVFFKTWFR